jgi:hypothetical protein
LRDRFRAAVAVAAAALASARAACASARTVADVAGTVERGAAFGAAVEREAAFFAAVEREVAFGAAARRAVPVAGGLARLACAAPVLRALAAPDAAVFGFGVRFRVAGVRLPPVVVRRAMTCLDMPVSKGAAAVPREPRKRCGGGDHRGSLAKGLDSGHSSG